MGHPKKLEGDASHLHGDTKGLWGKIPTGLRNHYGFLGKGGNAELLDIFEDELPARSNRVFSRPLEVEALCYLAAWFLDEDSDDYDAEAFESEIRHWGLSASLIEHRRLIEESEGITIPGSVLAALMT